MSSPPRSAREEERRLNLRTLVIASAASATAALVTSRLWIAGTWLAAAMTPVIVALVSEMLHRPTERIARGLTTDSPALPDPEAPARRVAERMRADEPIPDPEAPVRIYRTEAGRAPAPRNRRIAYRVVLVTAALAFAIAVAALTVPELIAGSSFGKSDARTTFFSRHSTKKDSNQSQTPAKTTPERTDTTQQPTTTDTTPTETTTTSTTTETTPPTQPTDTAPTPTSP